LRGQWPITSTGKEEGVVFCTELMGILQLKVRQMVVLGHTKGEICESSVTVPFGTLTAHNPHNLAK